MHKYGVETEVEKTASETKMVCPSCGGEVDTSNTVVICVNCGSKPFEKQIETKKEK